MSDDSFENLSTFYRHKKVESTSPGHTYYSFQKVVYLIHSHTRAHTHIHAFTETQQDDSFRVAIRFTELVCFFFFFFCDFE